MQKGLSRRFIASMLTILFAFASLSYSLGEQNSWDCPDCGRTGNRGNYCGGCGHPAPTFTPKPEKVTSANIGDIIQFGHYEQDGNTYNGKEPIDWYILDIDENGVLLISLYALDSMAYNITNNEVNWETCSLRTWLNDTFYKSAFSEEDKSHIVASIIIPSKSVNTPSQKTVNQGHETQDHVFLLTDEDVNVKYKQILIDEGYTSEPIIPGTVPLSAPKTIQAKKNVVGKDYNTWWLRGGTYDQTSDYPYAVICVNEGTTVLSPITMSGYGVRPLIRIDSTSSAKITSLDLIPSYYPTATPSSAPALSSFSAIGSTDIGSIIMFGKYEQDNNLENGSEPIEWIILSIENNKVLLLSKYGLDAMASNPSLAQVSWANSTLRTWLNDTFYKSAFTLDEQECIIMTEVRTDGSLTLDKVFLLSKEEALQDYIDIIRLFPCENTEFASSQGCFDGWKLRTSMAGTTYGFLQFEKTRYGEIFTSITSRSDDIGAAIRPAICIDLSKLSN